MCHGSMRWQTCGNHCIKALCKQNADDFLSTLLLQKITADGTEQLEQSVGGHFVINSPFVGILVLDAASQFDSAYLCIPQNVSCLLHPYKIEQQVGRKIAASCNHTFGEHINFHRSSY